MMADHDIPIAYGTAIPMDPMPVPMMATAPHTTATTSTTANDGRPSLQAAQGVMGRSSRVNLPQGASEKISENAIKQLQQQGYTRGLAISLIQTKRNFPLRIFLVDNSGSMQEKDGHRLVETARTNEVKLVPCTRWGEMQETVMYHSQMAALISAPTVFRLLNDPGAIHGPQQFSVAERGDAPYLVDQDLSVALSTVMNSEPGGVTPLVQHLKEIRDNVMALEPELRHNGTRVAITIATYVSLYVFGAL